MRCVPHTVGHRSCSLTGTHNTTRSRLKIASRHVAVIGSGQQLTQQYQLDIAVFCTLPACLPSSAACPIDSSRHTCGICTHHPHRCVCYVLVPISAMITRPQATALAATQRSQSVSTSQPLKRIATHAAAASSACPTLCCMLIPVKNITRQTCTPCVPGFTAWQCHMWQSAAIRHNTNRADPSQSRKQCQQCSTQRNLQPLSLVSRCSRPVALLEASMPVRWRNQPHIQAVQMLL